MKIRNRILTGILSLVLAAGELLPVCAAGTEQEINAGEEDQDRSGEPLQEETAAGEGEEEWFELDYTDKLVRMGGFPEAEDMAEADRIGDVDLGSAEEAIVDALRNFQPEIDVSAYGIPRQGAGDYYFRVLNRHPDLFYVEGRVSLSPVGDCVGRYRPTYSSEYNQSHVKKFYNKVDSILKGVDASWSKLEKVLYLHDYLVTHCDYQRSKPYSKYNAYNSLVEGESVCQGYAEGFEYLLQRIGVDGQVVTSNGINHAWNVLKMDGKWFYIDCTWDDPLGRYGPYCGHTNFLRSAAGMRATRHSSSDWIGAEDGADLDANIPGSSLYDSYFWSDITSALPRVGRLTLTVSGETGKIYDFSTGRSTDYAVNGGSWPVFGGYGWWEGEFAQAVAVGDRFFYSTCDSIYSMTTEGKQRKVYGLSENEQAKGYIYGLSTQDNVIRYWVVTGPDKAMDKAYVGSYTVKTVQIPAEISLDRDELKFTEAGQSVKLTAVVKDKEGEIIDEPELSFASTNENVVTVDEDGKIVPVNAGFAQVVVSCEDVSAVCRVKVAFSDHAGIVLSAETLQLRSTQPEAQLEGMLIGEDGKEDTSAVLIFASEDENVAAVSAEGLVTAVYDGNTYISVSCGEFMEKCSVNVELLMLSPPTADPADKTELLYADSIRLFTDKEGAEIRYTTDGIEPTAASAIYSSPIIIGEEDLGEEKVIKAFASAAYYKDSPVAEFHYPVVDKAGITLSAESMRFIRIGRCRKLTATVRDHRGDTDGDAELHFESLDPGVASVDEEGRITACGNGETTILVKSGTLTAQCAVKVDAVICRVDFYAHDELVGNVSVNQGDCVKEIPKAEASLGWYDREAGELWDPLMPVMHDLRLDASFEEDAKEKRSALDPTAFLIDNELYLVKGQSVDLSKEGSCMLTEGTSFVALSKKGVLKAKKAGEASLTITKAADGETRDIRVYVAEPVLSRKSLRMLPGDEEDLDLRLFCGSRELTQIYPAAWHSSAPSVAMVSGGRVAALSKGSATITAYVNGKAYKCKVTVADTTKPVLTQESAGSDVKLSDITLQPLQKCTLKLQGVSFKNREWTSDQPLRSVTKGKKTTYENDVLRIESSGKLTAVGSGTCTIAFTDESGRRFSMNVSVPEPQERQLFLNVGKKSTLRFYGVKNAKADFVSNAPSVVSVSDKGVVTAAETGVAVISCSYEGFEFRTLVHAENWALEEDDTLARVKRSDQYSYALTLKQAAGGDFRIKILSEDGYAGQQKLLFTSSKATVAFADEYGVIHAVNAGKTTITAKVNGKKIMIKVTVTP